MIMFLKIRGNLENFGGNVLRENVRLGKSPREKKSSGEMSVRGKVHRGKSPWGKCVRLPYSDNRRLGVQSLHHSSVGLTSHYWTNTIRMPQADLRKRKESSCARRTYTTYHKSKFIAAVYPNRNN
jgi:hypothetical protein